MSLTARIQWDADPSSKSHFIQYRVEGSSNWITPIPNNPTVNNHYDIPDLYEGVTYDFKIISECCGGSSEQIIRGVTPCPSTSNLTASLSGNTVTLNWDIKPWASSYNIKYKKDSDSSYIVPAGSPTSINTFTIPDLDYGQSYSFIVSVNCPTGVSSEIGTSINTDCPSPTDIISGFTDTIANLSWTTGYIGQLFKVEYKKQVDTVWIVFSSFQGATTANIPGMEYGTTYNFRVTGLCTSSMSTPLLSTSTSSCPSIIGLTATNV